MRYFLLSGLVGLSFIGSLFLYTKTTHSLENTVLISEIGAFEQTGQEWIEIFNAGNHPVNLTEWKFFENQTQHSLLLYQGTSTLATGTYAIIAQDASSTAQQYILPSTTIFDTSWGSLNESGEEIGLINQDGVLIEKFTYPTATEHSLERLSFITSSSSTRNWKEHHSSSSIGKENYWSSTSETVVPTISPTSSNPAPSTSTTAVASSTTTSTSQNASPTPTIIINEIVSNPVSGSEWVELFHASTSSITTTISLNDGAGEFFSGTIHLLPHSYYVIELEQNKLNNSGDQISLIFSTTTIDTLVYGDWDKEADLTFPAPQKGESLSKFGQDFLITTQLTKGEENILKQPITNNTKQVDNTKDQDTQKEREEESTAKEEKHSKLDLLGNIIISEILPNPSGNESTDEFIEIYNADTKNINLNQWKLGDASSKRFTLQNIVIEPQEYKVFYRSETGIALNNSGPESVSLYSPDNTLIHSIAYTDHVEDDLSYAFNNKEFLWTKTPTPGTANTITKPQTESEIVIYADTSSSTLLGSDDNDQIDDEGEKQYITDLAQYLLISEFLPNPTGSEDQEFIELYNPLNTSIPLTNLKIDDEDGGSTPYTFKKDETIGALSYLLLPRQKTGIALNNTGDSVRLLLPNLSPIDEVSYAEVIEGASYIKDTNDQWVQTNTPTPGTKNNIAPIIEEGETKTNREKEVLQALFSNLSSFDMGDQVSITGTVAVLPDIFGSQYFYMTGKAGNGIQVYSYNKDFPALTLGDTIRVTGELAQLNNEHRIKLSTKEDIQILDIGKIPEPLPIEIAQLGDSYVGGLLAIRGEITEKKSNYLWIDDGTDEIKIYIKKGTGISTKDLFTEQTVQITGILSKSKSAYQLLPRSQEDISPILQTTTSTPETRNIIEPQSNQQRNARLYLGATSIGLLFICLSLLFAYKKRNTRV